MTAALIAPAATPAPAQQIPRKLDFALVFSALLALALSAAPLLSGYYALTAWAPLTLAVAVVLIVMLAVAPPRLTRFGAAALAALLALLALSALSLLWAQSRQNAWYDSDRLALYALIFVLALTAIRSGQAARVALVLLGAGSLVAGLVLALEFIFGSGAGAFLSRRLNSPIGYVNGTAGLMAMGIWPWLALAERAVRRWVRGAAIAAATLVAATAALTQSRAMLPALATAMILCLMAERGRTRRTVLLATMLLGVALALPWLLHVYTQGGFPDHDLAPTRTALRGAGAAALLSATLIGLLRFAGSLLWERVPAARRQLLEPRLGQVMLAAVAVVVLAGVVAGWPHISGQYHAFVSDSSSSRTSVRYLEASGPRYDLWRTAVREFRAHPLGGVGAGNYDTYYYRLRTTSAYVLNPHSIELQMLSELGIFGLLALVVFCGTVFWSAFRRHGTLAAGDPLLRIAALGIFSTWLVETSVDWLYDIPALTGMALVSAAVLLLPAPGAVTAPQSPRTPTRSGALALPTALVALVAIAVTAASVGRLWVADLYGSGGSAQILTAPQAALQKLHTSYTLDPDNLQTLYWIADAYHQLGDFTDQRATLLNAQSREPDNYVPPALLGELAASREQKRLAARYFRRSLQLNPIDPTIATQLRALR